MLELPLLNRDTYAPTRRYAERFARLGSDTAPRCTVTGISSEPLCSFILILTIRRKKNHNTARAHVTGVFRKPNEIK